MFKMEHAVCVKAFCNLSLFCFFFGFLFLYILKFKKKCRFNASHVLPPQYIFPMIPQAATHIHIFFLFCFLEGKINVIKLTTSFQVFFPSTHFMKLVFLARALLCYLHETAVFGTYSEHM